MRFFMAVIAGKHAEGQEQITETVDQVPDLVEDSGIFHFMQPDVDLIAFCGGITSLMAAPPLYPNSDVMLVLRWIR
jgi:H2-forming N5,N10-methylenetetrahydromethanopterin dehydrogenase-like enzyme